MLFLLKIQRGNADVLTVCRQTNLYQGLYLARDTFGL